MAGGGGAKGLTEYFANKVLDASGIREKAANDKARQMYEDAVKKNTLYQGMQDRWNARQATGGQVGGAVNPAAGVVNNIANTALRNVSGQNTTDYGVMGTQGTGGNASVRSQYQGS